MIGASNQLIYVGLVAGGGGEAQVQFDTYDHNPVGQPTTLERGCRKPPTGSTDRDATGTVSVRIDGIKSPGC